MVIRTDGDLIKAARRMQTLAWQIQDLIHEIEDSEHVNAAACAKDMWEQCWFPAFPTSVVKSYLEHPEQWRSVTADLEHIGAKKAVYTRKHTPASDEQEG